MTKEELIALSDLNREDNIKYISSEAQGIAIALDSDRYAPTLCKLERAYICGRRKSEKYIAGLEKEKCKLLGIIQGKDKAIAALKKENAQLKEQNANLVAMLKSEREVRVNDDYLRSICELESKVEDWTSEYYELENFMNNKLAKAKEIVKKFSEFVNNDAEYGPEHPQEHTDKWNKLCEQVEQFLSEAEK